MRKDMSKVIVERPRGDHRGEWARPGRSRPLEDDEGAPLRTRAPVRNPQKTKGLNENLAPLKRYLAQQVGRPWDKVFSEISEHLRPTSTVQQHVRDHIEDFVAVQTRMRDGKVVTLWRGGGKETPLDQEWRKLYVHPRTGLLRQNAAWRSWNVRHRERREAEDKARAARMRELEENRQLHLLKGGLWWEVRLARIKVHKTKANRSYEEPYEDVVFAAGLSDLPPQELYGRRGVYAAAKRTLSKAEKKRYGLK
jgi:hypothetical protein